jgi:hypothetical protein
MQNIDTIVTGLAEDLARQSGANDPAIEPLMLNAFRRGSQLGLSIRDWRALMQPKNPQTRRKEPGPCARRH